ncbi:MAG: hypothetical protein ACR2OJ_12780, partial [Hyphomicrobiales bacterium]
MKKTLIIAIAFCGFTSSALACTPEEMQAKAIAASTALQQLASKNPTRVQEIMTEMQNKAAEVQSSNDM